MPDQQIQVNLEDDFVNDTITKYLKKRDELEKFKIQLNDLMSKIDILISNDNEDIILCNEIKSVREETYAYNQKNLELQRKNRCLKEYLELKRQKDDIELDIYENDMRRQLRINMIETKYLITPPNSCVQSTPVNNQPPPPPPINNAPPPPINNNAPPPPPPPINNNAPPPPPPPAPASINNNIKQDKPVQNQTRQERSGSMDLSGELKHILNQKFKGARGDDTD